MLDHSCIDLRAETRQDERPSNPLSILELGLQYADTEIVGVKKLAKRLAPSRKA
jgi:hypothetical protein